MGLFAGFPNPFWHVPPLVLLYPAALCLIGLRAAHGWSALRLGWLCGLAGSSAALYWIALPVHTVGGMPWILAAPCAMAIGAYVGLYGGLFCLGAYTLRAHSPLLRALELGLLWYLLEWLRGILFTGFPWLTLGAAFVPWPSLLQGASIIGVYALGGVYVTAACWMAAPSARKSGLVAGILLLVTLILWGNLRLAQNPPVAANAQGTYPIVFIEGNIDQNHKWDKAWQQSSVDTYLNLSRKALQDYPGQSPLVVWPETALPLYYQDNIQFGAALRNFAATHKIPLLFGAPGYIKNEEARSFQTFNRAYLINPDGVDAGFYDKEHLVPFGEYLPPWLAFDFLVPLLQGIGDFTPGVAAAPLKSGNISLGMLICYESIFPQLAQERVAAGANVLLNISNDGWFGLSSAAQQHLELAAVRTVEQGRWLLRGTNTGISAVVDSMGRTVTRGGQFTAQSVSAYMRPLTDTTIYHHLAPWLPWVGLALFGLLFILGCPRRK